MRAKGESIEKAELIIRPGELLDTNQELLTNYGITLSGDLKGLEIVQIDVVQETMNQGENFEDVWLNIEEDGEVISPDSTFAGAGPNVKLLHETEDTSYESKVDFLSPARNRRSCPTRTGFGYANDSILTIRIFGYRFNIRCGEDCCARQWQCANGQCRWSCGRYTYTVRTNHFICCSISGRTVYPFPSGNCANRFLCAA